MQGSVSQAYRSSRVVVLLAAAGAAVGRGNLWRFPDLAGVTGAESSSWRTSSRLRWRATRAAHRAGALGGGLLSL